MLQPFRDTFRTGLFKSRPKWNFGSQTTALEFSTLAIIVSWHYVGLGALIVLHRTEVIGSVPRTKKVAQIITLYKIRGNKWHLTWGSLIPLTWWTKKCFCISQLLKLTRSSVHMQSAKKCLCSCTVLFCPEIHECFSYLSQTSSSASLI